VKNAGLLSVLLVQLPLRLSLQVRGFRPTALDSPPRAFPVFA
jgi:hypothetical protein